MADEGLNKAARDLQLMDFNNSLSELKRKDDRGPKAVEGVSVSYRLANRTSLPSRSDRQLIQIASLPLKGDFYRLATPVLTSFVYEETRLTNTSDRVFLAGPAATFMGGQFVGRGDLPTVAVGESFTVGLGIDSSLRAERELVNKERARARREPGRRFHVRVVAGEFWEYAGKGAVNGSVADGGRERYQGDTGEER